MKILLDADEMKGAFRFLHVNTNNVDKSLLRKVTSTVCSLLQCVQTLVGRRPKLTYLMVTRSRFGCVKDLVVMILSQLTGIPVVVHVRGGDLGVFYDTLGTFARYVVRSAYRRVSVGIVLGESLRGQFDGLLPPERVRVVLNCWQDGECKVLSCRAKRSADRPLRLAFVSNILPSKGLYDALRGVAWAIQHGVKLDLRFAGEFLNQDGAIAKLPEFAHENRSAQDLEDYYDRLVADLRIASHVERLGVVAGRQKWELLAETDMVLLPIYNPTEGQPLVAIEAMRAGCVLVSTQCGGLVDIVEDGVTGKVVPPRSPVEIGQAIKWFWDHPDEVERIGNANMARAERMHSPREHIRRIREIFDEVLSNRGKLQGTSHVE
jgi:glycosyltransferase involved in cell wall biosynthesis